jgi:hypothetical protein
MDNEAVTAKKFTELAGKLMAHLAPLCKGSKKGTN